MKILILGSCHRGFGGWYRGWNIYQSLSDRYDDRIDYWFPRRRHSLIIRIVLGIINMIRVLVGKWEVVHVLELVQPETFPTATVMRLLKRPVVVDVGDEWLDSPTYHRACIPLRFLITLLDTRWISHYSHLTTTSFYLKKKYGALGVGNILVLKNYVNKSEFQPMSRLSARRSLGLGLNDKILLSFGNTFGNQRAKWRNETYKNVQFLDETIRLINLSWSPAPLMGMYLSACDLVLFPTGNSPAEQACFPIRVGSCLNAERVIATDQSNTEFHNTLSQYKCLVAGKTPESLAVSINYFFTNPDYRQEVESNVVIAKKTLDWSNHIGGLYEFYCRTC